MDHDEAFIAQVAKENGWSFQDVKGVIRLAAWLEEIARDELMKLGLSTWQSRRAREQMLAAFQVTDAGQRAAAVGAAEEARYTMAHLEGLPAWVKSQEEFYRKQLADRQLREEAEDTDGHHD